MDARAERSTRVHRFGCGVRLPSSQNNRGCGCLASGGSSRGAEACVAAQPATEVGAGGPAGAALAAGARRPEIEETRRPLD